MLKERNQTFDIALWFSMNEVNVDSLNLSHKLWKAVENGFLFPPVIFILPVLHYFLYSTTKNEEHLLRESFIHDNLYILKTVRIKRHKISPKFVAKSKTRKKYMT